jgi:hypothetical protein
MSALPLKSGHAALLRHVGVVPLAGIKDTLALGSLRYREQTL